MRWSNRPPCVAFLVLLLTACGGGGGTVEPVLDSDAALAGLTLSAGTLSPTFTPGVTAYTVGPAVLPTALSVTATTSSATAMMVTVNGVATASGTPSASIPLGMGAVTTITIVVTAEDALTQRTYQIAVDRTSPALSALTVSAGVLTPVFDPVVTVYDVPAVLSSPFVVTPTAEDPGATILVNGVAVGSGAASLSIPLAAGLNVVTIEVTARDSATSRTYVLTVTHVLSQEAYLKASNTGARDSFGFSVALSGDTLVLGAYEEDSSATGVGGNEADNAAQDSGAVYVFIRSGATWSQQAYLKASNTGAGDNFGYSLSLSGDTLVVGASREDSSATGVGGNQADNGAQDSGAVYVFVRSGTSWSQQAYLKASNTAADDLFGWNVSLSGDTLVVGCFGEDSSATGVDGNQADNSAAVSGAAYVFVRSGTTWSQQAYLKASNTGAGDQFGRSVALSGDTLVVGAYNEDSSAVGVDGNQADNGAQDSGAVYVFVRSGTSWSQQAYLKASNTAADDLFGWSVSLSGDTLVVGCFGEDSSATGVDGNQADNSAAISGAAYVFVRSGTSWSQQAYLKASNTSADDRFGWSVSLSGDTLVVGSYGEDSSATGVDGNQADNSAASSGAAYVFVRSGTTWSQRAYIKASNTDAGDLVGIGVAVSGDTLVVGAYNEDSSAVGVDGNQADNTSSDSGAAYVFR